MVVRREAALEPPGCDRVLRTWLADQVNKTKDLRKANLYSSSPEVLGGIKIRLLCGTKQKPEQKRESVNKTRVAADDVRSHFRQENLNSLVTTLQAQCLALLPSGLKILKVCSGWLRCWGLS